MCVDPSTEARRRTFPALLPSSPIERLYACTHGVAESYARQRRHPVGRVLPWRLASVAIPVAAMCRILPRVRAPLDAEPEERHKKRFRLRSTGRSPGNAACQYARPSIRPLVEAPPLANAPSNRRICRREYTRRMSRGRAPPLECLPLRFTRQGRPATIFEKMDGTENHLDLRLRSSSAKNLNAAGSSRVGAPEGHTAGRDTAFLPLYPSPRVWCKSVNRGFL